MPLTIDIAANAALLQQRITKAAARAGRDPASIRLVAVSKTFPPERIAQAYECGLRDFGENRVQEFRQKLPQLNLPGAVFHMIGHLQSNKVQPAMAFDWVQTLDSSRLALRLSQAAVRAGKTLSVLIEVKFGREALKTGVSKEETALLASLLRPLEGLALKGLMTMPPYSEDPEEARPCFRRLRELRDRLQEAGFPELQELSMGMTHDFEVAIEEGATIVRVGTGIFGPRPVAKQPSAQ